jgi:Glycosyl hydrolases family 15
VRERLVSQRTGIINQIRAFLLERGVAVRQGPADRRHRRGAHDFAARSARWRPQLGLSVLLAPRRNLHADGTDGRRLSPGGGRVADMAAAGRRWKPRSGADHVRACRERRLDEWLLPWLSGYEASNPVRIGNAAAGQLQIDIYGEVLDALYQASVLGLGDVHVDWDLQSALIQHLAAIWKEPDDGIWEVRGERRHFTHSKVMAWVAFDRAIKSVDRYGVPGPGRTSSRGL